MDFNVYDIKTRFTIREAAYLWCEKDIPALPLPKTLVPKNFDYWMNTNPPRDVLIIVSKFKEKLRIFGTEIGERINWGNKVYQGLHELIKDEIYFKKQANKRGYLYKLSLGDLFPMRTSPYPFEFGDRGYDAENCVYLINNETCDGCDVKKGSCEGPIARKPNFEIIQDDPADFISPGFLKFIKQIETTIMRSLVPRDALIRFAKELNQKPLFLFPERREPTVSLRLDETLKELAKSRAEKDKLKAELEKLQGEKLPPFMDKNHFYYSAKLEAAVSAWETIFMEGRNEIPSKAKRIEDWLEKNRPGIANPDAIVRVVNPTKQK